MATFVQDGQPQLSDRGAGVYGGAASLGVHGGEISGVFCADGAGGVEAPRAVLSAGDWHLLPVPAFYNACVTRTRGQAARASPLFLYKSRKGCALAGHGDSKNRATISGVTASSVGGFHTGALSLSITSARIPSSTSPCSKLRRTRPRSMRRQAARSRLAPRFSNSSVTFNRIGERLRMAASAFWAKALSSPASDAMIASMVAPPKWRSMA